MPAKREPTCECGLAKRKEYSYRLLVGTRKFAAGFERNCLARVLQLEQKRWKKRKLSKTRREEHS